VSRSDAMQTHQFGMVHPLAGMMMKGAAKCDTRVRSFQCRMQMHPAHFEFAAGAFLHTIQGVYLGSWCRMQKHPVHFDVYRLMCSVQGPDKIHPC